MLRTLPAPLSDGVVFFVNSGSEANDLAIRLARAHTGRLGTIVCEHAYHGHTVATLGESPYKFNHPKAHATARRPEWVRVVPTPDIYRGAHRGDDAGERYAGHVRDACLELAQAAQDAGEPTLAPGAFLLESGMSVAGVLTPPRGYLRACYAAVRAAGGIASRTRSRLGSAGARGRLT